MAAKIVAAMRAAVRERSRCLSVAEVQCLRDLTRALLTSKPDALAEYHRFLAIAERAISLPDSALETWLPGRAVLVTGGTGCIGSVLMAQLTTWSPRRWPRGRWVSVSREYTGGPRLRGTEYAHADIRDPGRLTAIFREVRPDV